MQLFLLHPEVGARRCSDCKRWWYDGKTGELKRDREKNPLPRGDRPLACETKKGCPRGTPENEMRPHNWRAYYHYLECKATGCWPDDWTVRRNAALILAVEESAARTTAQRHMYATEAVAKIMVTWLEAMSGTR